MDLRTVAQSGVDPGTGRYLTPAERKSAFMKGMGRKTTMNPSKFLSSGSDNSANPPAGDQSQSDASPQITGSLIKDIRELFNLLNGGAGPAGGGNTASARKNSMSGKGSAIVKRVNNAESNGGRGGGALTKQIDEFPIIRELRLINKSAEKLFKLRSERLRLESKYASTKNRAEERKKSKQEEQEMESRKQSGGNNIFKKAKNKIIQQVGLNLFGLLQSIITYGILDWISKPENKNQVELMVRGFSGLFKFFDWFITLAVDKTFGGFFKLFGGGSILERMFGFFEMIFGIFLFKGFLGRLFNPLKLIGDIKWIFKNAGKFVDLFKSLSTKNLGKAFDTLKSIFPKTLSLFRRGFGRGVKRLMSRIFGRGITKLIGPLFKKATKFLLRPLAAGTKIIPIIGGLLSVPINMFLGDPIDKAIFKSAGATLGAIAVGALGSIVPGAGTVLGAFAGGLLGEWLGSFMYDRIVPGLKGIFGKKEPQLSTGGIAEGPESGYPVTLHGTEAVIPIGKFSEIALIPFKTVASILIGSTFAVLKSFGGVGQLLSPIAMQMFNPFIKLFGITTETFSSGIGKFAKGAMNIFMSSASDREFPDLPPTRGEMVQRNINRSKGRGTKQQPTGEDPEIGPIQGGPMHQKGANIAKKLMSLLGIKDYQAAGIVGNLIQESALVPDRVQGSGMKRGALKVDGVTGYSYPQWTSRDRQQNFANYMQSKGFDWRNKKATDEMATGFLAKEFKGYMSNVFTNTKNVSQASNWTLFNYEKPADQGSTEQKERAQDAQAVLSKMASGGQLNLLASNAKTTYYDPALGGINASGAKTRDGLPATSTGEGYRPNVFSAAAFPPMIVKLPKENLANASGFPGGKTLKKPVNVVVTNSKGKQAVVRINDVGPGVSGHASNHMLDLSVAAKNFFGTGGGFKIEGPTTAKPGPLDGTVTPEAASTTTRQTSTSPQQSPPDKTKQETPKITGDLISDIIQLYKLLNPGDSPQSSTLPDMSKNFTLGMKMDQLLPGLTVQPIIVSAPTNMVATAYSNINLNSSTISEKANLNKI